MAAPELVVAARHSLIPTVASEAEEGCSNCTHCSGGWEVRTCVLVRSSAAGRLVPLVRWDIPVGTFLAASLTTAAVRTRLLGTTTGRRFDFVRPMRRKLLGILLVRILRMQVQLLHSIRQICFRLRCHGDRVRPEKAVGTTETGRACHPTAHSSPGRFFAVGGPSSIRFD